MFALLYCWSCVPSFPVCQVLTTVPFVACGNLVWTVGVGRSLCRWFLQYDRLVDWKAKHGHTRVPFVAGELGWWVNTQRQSERKGRLLPKRKAKLDAIDFCFYPQERVRPLCGAVKAMAGTGGGEAAAESSSGDREGSPRTGGGGAHGGASAAAGVPSVAAGAAAISKKRKSENVGAAAGRRSAGGLSPPRRPAHPVAAHPPCVASATQYQQQVAAQGLKGPPPPPPTACAGVLPPLAGSFCPDAANAGALPRATSDGVLRAPGSGTAMGGGLLTPWGLPRVEADAAGPRTSARRSTSWEAASASRLASAASPNGPWALFPSMTRGQTATVPGPHEGESTRPYVEATSALQQPAPLPTAGPLAPFRAFGEPVPIVAVRAVPIREQQPQSPRPTPATGACPPSPSDRFLVRPRSPASSSSSSSSYAGIDMGHHRRVPLPPSSYVPPQGIPSIRHPPSLANVPRAVQSSPGRTLAAPHTTSTGSPSPPLLPAPASRPSFPSLPLPPPAALLSWTGVSSSGAVPLSPPVLSAGEAVPSAEDGARRPMPPKLPPFSSLLAGTTRGVPAPAGLAPTASTPLTSGTAGRVSAWLSASSPGRDTNGVAATSATFSAGYVATSGEGSAWLLGHARQPAPPPSGSVLAAAPRH